MVPKDVWTLVSRIFHNITTRRTVAIYLRHFFDKHFCEYYVFSRFPSPTPEHKKSTGKKEVMRKKYFQKIRKDGLSPPCHKKNLK